MCRPLISTKLVADSESLGRSRFLTLVARQLHLTCLMMMQSFQKLQLYGTIISVTELTLVNNNNLLLNFSIMS